MCCEKKSFWNYVIIAREPKSEPEIQCEVFLFTFLIIKYVVKCLSCWMTDRPLELKNYKHKMSDRQSLEGVFFVHEIKFGKFA